MKNIIKFTIKFYSELGHEEFVIYTAEEYSSIIKCVEDYRIRLYNKSKNDVFYYKVVEAKISNLIIPEINEL